MGPKAPSSRSERAARRAEKMRARSARFFSLNKIVSQKQVDIGRSKEGCLHYREFEAIEGTFAEVAGGPSTLPDIGENVYMMMMEYSNETRFREIAAMPDVQVAAGHLIPTINAVSFFLSQVRRARGSLPSTLISLLKSIPAHGLSV